ncbi:MAG TPA: tryptophanase, partial [Pantanalinema sp.]
MLPAPYRNKIVRPVGLPSPAERLRLIEEAGYNVARLPSVAVPLDLLTDSGQAALSDRQWSAMGRGDEAYAGSRSFAALEASVYARFGLPFTVPAHQGRAAENLLAQHLLNPGTRVFGNALHATTRRIIAHAQASFHEVGVASAWDFASSAAFKGDLDLERLEAAHGEAHAPGVVWLAMTSEPIGGQAVSLANLRRVSAWARSRGLPVVVDASRLHENAWTIRRHEAEAADLAAAVIARQVAACADYLYLSGKKVGLSSVGGLIATADRGAMERLRRHCIVFEGMPFYGGMAGRDMEALAIGLEEAFDDAALFHRAALIARLAQRLSEGGVPLVTPAGGHAVFLDASRFAPGLGATASAAITAWLYVISGVRTAAVDTLDDRGRERRLVRLALPARSHDEAQLDWAASGVLALHAQREALPPLSLAGTFEGLPPGEPRFAPIDSSFAPPRPLTGATVPYRARVVELTPPLSRAQREAALERAGYNLYHLSAQDAAIDCFTDSGTNAMSDRAWGEMVAADEAYRGSDAYARFATAVREAYGYPHVLPAHQGRGAEALLSEALIRDGRAVVIGNQPFTTTQTHILRCGGRFVDVSLEAAFRPGEPHPFKGDVDLARLEAAIQEHGPERIAYLNLGVTVNASGGQPVRLSNLEAVKAIADRHGLPLYLDATRAVENAWFIREREEGMGGRTIADLLRAIAACADGVTVSAKKDLMTNIGGFLALRDPAVAERAWRISERLVGYPASGGLANRDLLAMACGIAEMRDDATVTHRILQVKELGERLLAAGLPVIAPIGGHAVFVDAEAFLPHLGRQAHPGHALAAALYLESGVRGMMVKGQFEGRKGVELLRIALPRRVYGPSHLDSIARALVALNDRATRIPGLSLESEPAALRATLSRFCPLPPAPRWGGVGGG